MSPETTGDTASGRSISVMRMLLPRNSNLAIHHAAVMPKTVFNGTTMAAVVSVSRMAARVSGSAKLEKYATHPFEMAVASTAASGAASSAPRKVSDTVINIQRTRVARRLVCPGREARSAATSADEDPPAHYRDTIMRLRPHTCSRLMASSMTKEIASITQPSAAAPA